MTNDLVEVIVPNAMLARAPIRNYSRPSTVSRRLVTVQGPYAASPERVHEAILAALVDAPSVLSDPAPWVQTRSFGDSGVEYGVYFFTSDFASRDAVDGRVRDRVWYALQRAGIQVPFPVRNVHVHQVSDDSVERDHAADLERRERILRCVDFLDVLPPDARRALVGSARVRLYAPDELVVRQGETSTELFIIERGEVVVETGRPGSTVAVARLGAKKFFGEMGLMTGEARSASVRAVTECELLVVDHEAFQGVLAAHPEVVGRMSELLAVRQAELEQAVASKRPRQDLPEDRSKRLISQIKDFFKL
jgi:CRP-like cAMP-binding protein